MIQFEVQDRTKNTQAKRQHCLGTQGEKSGLLVGADAITDTTRDQYYWYSILAMKTPLTLVPVVTAAEVFQYLASTEKLPLVMVCTAMLCCAVAFVAVRSIPSADVATVVGVVGTKSITKLVAFATVAVLLAFLILTVSAVAVEKRTLKVPFGPPWIQVGTVGFTKKVVL